MRSKQINYRNRAAGLTAVKAVSNVGGTTVLRRKNDILTSSKLTAVTDKAAVVTNKTLATPVDDAAADDPVVDVNTATKKNAAVADVPAEGSDAPMAASGAPETGAQSQPETNKTVNFRTWIIVGIAALILLYLYRKKK